MWKPGQFTIGACPHCLSSACLCIYMKADPKWTASTLFSLPCGLWCSLCFYLHYCPFRFFLFFLFCSLFFSSCSFACQVKPKTIFHPVWTIKFYSFLFYSILFCCLLLRVPACPRSLQQDRCRSPLSSLPTADCVLFPCRAPAPREETGPQPQEEHLSPAAGGRLPLLQAHGPWRGEHHPQLPGRAFSLFLSPSIRHVILFKLHGIRVLSRKPD